MDVRVDHIRQDWRRLHESRKLPKDLLPTWCIIFVRGVTRSGRWSETTEDPGHEIDRVWSSERHGY